MRYNPVPFPSAQANPNNFIDPVLEGFWNLPSLVKPPPVVENPNPDSVALVILFTDDYRRSENLQAWVRGAIYNRWSCLQYSDAVSQGIEVKLYIEDVLRNVLSPALTENFIDVDRDVIWFHAPRLEKGLYGYLGKQMSPYWDSQLATYKRIMVWDADTFFLPRPNSMFAKLKDFPTNKIGYILVSTEKWSIFRNTLISRLKMDIKKGGVPVDELFQMAGINLDGFSDYVLKPFGCMWTYSPAYFHKHHSDFVNWMQSYAPYFGNDELLATCWNQLFNIDILSLSNELDLSINPTDSYMGSSIQNKKTNVLHGLFHRNQTINFYNLLYGL